MNIEDVIKLVNTNRGNGKKENLYRMNRLMEKLGNPQNKLKFVHIAGTNGKGTTASFISSILKESDIKTGLFTSPHLEVINERIQVDQELISDDSFIRCTEIVAPYVKEVEEELSENLYSFEILTAVAFVYFLEQACELVVLETGIGGRLDSTNVIKTPEAAVITSIGMDHMNMLGETLEEIAKEKAGIIKSKGSVISYDCSEPVRKVLKDKAAEEQAGLSIISLSDIESLSASVKGQTFSYKMFKDLSIQMIGEHQLSNAALAIETALQLKAKGFNISEDSIKNGLQKAFWAGRMERLSEKPVVIVDGAHNKQGVELLSKNIRSLFPDKNITFIVGMMKDKAYLEMIEIVEDIASKILTISPDPWRGFDAEETANILKAKGHQAYSLENPVDIVQYIRESASPNEVIIVFGSLYLVGDLRKNLIH